MLRLERFNSYYGGSHVLHDVSLEARAGEIMTVLGRNGVGKTTLLRSIMGLTDATTGLLELEGSDLAAKPTHQRARAGIAYVPQGREIIPDFTVRENILMGGFAAAGGGFAASIPEVVGRLFPYLMENLERPGGLLSGGQQQQLAIGRALVMRPKLLVLDEPTEGIQPSIIKDIGRAIDYLRRRGDMAILLVEQYFEFARDLADRFYVMDRGEIVMEGLAADMVEAEVRRHLVV